MKSKLLGYKIYDKYYMTEDVKFINKRVENELEMCDIYIKEEGMTTEQVLVSDIHHIYDHDKSSVEIVKIEVAKLKTDLRRNKCQIQKELQALKEEVAIITNRSNEKPWSNAEYHECLWMFNLLENKIRRNRLRIEDLECEETYTGVILIIGIIVGMILLAIMAFAN